MATEPRYKASYRIEYQNLFRRQVWFVKDNVTGQVAAEHWGWSRADAKYTAQEMNKKEAK